MSQLKLAKVKLRYRSPTTRIVLGSFASFKYSAAQCRYFRTLTTRSRSSTLVGPG